MTLDYQLFDADNHYYEATDAFTRHVDPAMAKRTMQWAELNGKQRLMVAGRINRFIPNPTFDPVAKPGALDAYFRGQQAGEDIRAAFGELDPISPAYREPAARLALMDDQNMEGCLLFPTLGVGMEQALVHDPEAAHSAFHAFNQWLDDDWQFAYADRIFAAPYFTLLDPDLAVAELDWVLERGARVVVMRAGPVQAPTGFRSPGDAVYDPFWARLAEAGTLVAYHSGESGYHRYAEEWGEKGEMEAFRHHPFTNITSADRPIYDTIAALICHGVFARHPGLRVATIESGSEWVPTLVRKMRKSFKQAPCAFAGGDPVQQLRDHVWVSPYYEDDLIALRESIGAERIVFGSDYPHAEGLADPAAFVNDLDGFDAAEIRLIMRENARGLVHAP
ncbi:MAG: amidohydrolase [Acidimicrobiia bacterium]|nr:amidohydrolase [Acidimicrobiia bacterium]